MMSGFTTESLLYPLTKGDVEGHQFHGNQWEKVGGEMSPTTRPPVGNFQFSSDELHTNANIMTKKGTAKRVIGDITSGELPQATVARIDEATVAMAKMLGYDKPAQRVDAQTSGEPTLFRGCDKTGADSLLQPLVKYTNGGGAWNGVGLHFTPYQQTAQRYIDAYGKGAIVKAWVDPNAKTIDYKDLRDLAEAKGDYFSIQAVEKDPTLSKFEKDNLSSMLNTPAGLAMAYGYQTLSGLNSGDVTIVLDRSVLKVDY